MSLFGEVDDADRRRRQQENLQGLNKLVELGAKQKLPPLFWRLPEGYGTLSGGVDTLGRDPRTVFEAWYAALSKNSRITPGEFRWAEGRPSRDERTTSDGQTRMLAIFKLQIGTSNSSRFVEFVLRAEWYADELDSAKSAEAVAR
jgi:hypothetical protein